MTTRTRKTATGAAAAPTGRTVAGAALFVLGFSAVFSLYGLGRRRDRTLLHAHTQGLTQILGGVTILLGLLFFGAFDRFMFAGRIFKPSLRPQAGLAGAPLLGVLFGVGWTPCLGPTLAAALTLSAQSGTAARGAFLAFLYGLGLGIPFLIVAALFQRLVNVLGFFKRNARMISRIGGVHAGGGRPARGHRRVDVGGQLAAHPLVRRFQHAAVGAGPEPQRRAPAFGFIATGLRGCCAARASPSPAASAGSRPRRGR